MFSIRNHAFSARFAAVRRAADGVNGTFPAYTAGFATALETRLRTFPGEHFN